MNTTNTTENYEELVALADRAEQTEGARAWTFANLAALLTAEAVALDAEANRVLVKRDSYAARATDCRIRAARMTLAANRARAEEAAELAA